MVIKFISIIIPWKMWQPFKYTQKPLSLLESLQFGVKAFVALPATWSLTPNDKC